jgi:hypothetical protein
MKLASKQKCSLANLFYWLIVVWHPLEFSIRWSIIIRIPAIPVFRIIFIELIRVIVQISLCWFGHSYISPRFLCSGEILLAVESSFYFQPENCVLFRTVLIAHVTQKIKFCRGCSQPDDSAFSRQIYFPHARSTPSPGFGF